jgi:hypothetical protein
MTPQKYIEKLEKLELEVAELRQRVNEMEHSRSKPFEITMPNMPYPTWVVPTACSVCGLPFDSVMGYACNNPQCPSGVSYCQTDN